MRYRHKKLGRLRHPLNRIRSIKPRQVGTALVLTGPTSMSTHNVIEKVEALPEDKSAEVEDFVDFLHARTEGPKCHATGSRRIAEDLCRRINERRERLRRERGVFSDRPEVLSLWVRGMGPPP